MIRLLFFVLFFTLLSGFTPMPEATLNPPQPRLGEPFRLVFPLPESNTELTGLPDLGSFRLLSPPQVTEESLALELLPVRTGTAIIPAFSLHKANRSWRTLPIELEITDPVSQKAQPEPLQHLPKNDKPISIRALSWFLLAVPFLLLPIGIRVLNRKIPASSVTVSSLKRLEEQLRQAPSSEEKARLLGTIRAWRFGPYAPSELELEELQKFVGQIATKGPA